jgi:hypothetical protein
MQKGSLRRTREPHKAGDPRCRCYTRGDAGGQPYGLRQPPALRSQPAQHESFGTKRTATARIKEAMAVSWRIPVRATTPML